MLKTSAFESLYGDQFTLSTQLIKPNYQIFLTYFPVGTEVNGAKFFVITFTQISFKCHVICTLKISHRSFFINLCFFFSLFVPFVYHEYN